MKLTSLALFTLLLTLPALAHGQSLSRASQLTQSSASGIKTEPGDDRVLAARAIAALKRLNEEVLVYRSLGDFEENGKLARVPFEVFKNDLREVTNEVVPVLSCLPAGKLKAELSNALDSYRDGAFWWQKIDQPRVVNVSALRSTEITRSPSDNAFLANAPYTVAIHWRQGGNYLKSAEKLMNVTGK